MTAENGAGGERLSGRFPFPDWYRDVIRLHAEGLNDREIAERLDVERHRVLCARGRLRLPANIKRAFTTHEIEVIRALAAEGLSGAAIARRIGRNDESVRNVAAREGIALTRGSRWHQSREVRPEHDLERLLPAIRTSYSKAEAARKAGVTVARIEQAMDYFKMPLGLSGGIVLENTTGDDASREEALRRYLSDPHLLAEDHGVAQIEKWLARTRADLAALHRLEDDLVAALVVHEERSQSPSESVARGK